MKTRNPYDDLVAVVIGGLAGHAFLEAIRGVPTDKNLSLKMLAAIVFPAPQLPPTDGDK